MCGFKLKFHQKLTYETYYMIWDFNLKLTGSHYGVVYYNPDVILVCDNRVFSFNFNPKSCNMSHTLIFGGLLI